MQKCGNKFCSKPGMKNTQECRNETLKNHPAWGGVCFWHRDGAGCPDCGGKMVRASGCKHCLDCGASSCV